MSKLYKSWRDGDGWTTRNGPSCLNRKLEPSSRCKVKSALASAIMT